MKLSNFLWLFGFVYVAFYMNGHIVKQKNYILKLEDALETRTYEFEVCKKLYKSGLTEPRE